MSSNVDTLRSGYEAFAREDIPAVLELFDADIEWYSPDELPDGGTYRGPDQVAGFFAALSRRYDELSVQPERYLAAGDDIVVVEGTHTGRIGTESFEVGFAHVWTLRDGKITRFREYMDSGKLLPLFASQPTAAGTS